MIQKPDDINYEERFEEYEMDAMERLHSNVYTDEEIEEMYQEHLLSQPLGEERSSHLENEHLSGSSPTGTQFQDEEPEEMSVLFEGEASEPQYPICSEGTWDYIISDFC